MIIFFKQQEKTKLKQLYALKKAASFDKEAKRGVGGDIPAIFRFNVTVLLTGNKNFVTVQMGYPTAWRCPTSALSFPTPIAPHEATKRSALLSPLENQLP